MNPIESDEDTSVTVNNYSSSIENVSSSTSIENAASSTSIENAASSTSIENALNNSSEVENVRSTSHSAESESIISNYEQIQHVEEGNSSLNESADSVYSNSDAPFYLDNESLRRLPVFENFSSDEIDEDLESSDGDNVSEYSSNSDDNAQYDAYEEESPFAYLQKLLQKDEFNECVNANIIISKSELLLGILKLSEKYVLPNSAVADLCKLFNTSVGKKILPDTRYKLDKMLFPTSQFERHGVCTKCGMYIKEYNSHDRFIHCENCDEIINVKNTSYNDFFVVIDFQLTLENLLNSNYEYYMQVMNGTDVDRDLKDIFYGRLYEEFRNNIPETHKKSYVSFTFNSDDEIPADVRNSKPIRHLLWFGHNKPDMNIMLRIFVEKINKLSDEDGGLNLTLKGKVKNIKVYAICCCVDTVARAPMQGTIQFNGYYGCNWCLHRGKRVFHKKGYTVKYPLAEDVVPDRTVHNTLEFAEQAVNTGRVVFGVKSASPLLLLNNFNIIDGFVPDFMHVLPLGIVRQITEYWINSKNKDYTLSVEQKNRVDIYLGSIKVPSHLSRFCRTINDRKFWKSREWENWLLYYSLPIISDFAQMREFADHWSLIVEAAHLLMQDKIEEHELYRANDLLKNAVAETERLYGEDAMTYNIHQLLHIVQSVIDWGPLWAHFGYPFENGNGQLLKVVHAAKGVINQMCRHIARNQSLIILENHVSVVLQDSPIMPYVTYLNARYTQKSFSINENRYFGKKKCLEDTFVEKFHLHEHHCVTYRRLLKNKCMFHSDERIHGKTGNSYAFTRDKDYISILKFIVNTETLEEYVICEKIEIIEDYSEDCYGIKKCKITNNTTEIIPTGVIEKPCVVIKIGNNLYISHVPNTIIYT
uniref:Transposase domain-containing protein n=1 Tax=Trichogramma kaykai TaxID=54128 RepID=A0ABD2WBX3_9HYME